LSFLIEFVIAEKEGGRPTFGPLQKKRRNGCYACVNLRKNRLGGENRLGAEVGAAVYGTRDLCCIGFDCGETTGTMGTGKEVGLRSRCETGDSLRAEAVVRDSSTSNAVRLRSEEGQSGVAVLHV